MSEETFLVATKSTIDKLCKTLANTLSIDYIDLDDTTETARLFGTDNNSLLFEFSTLQSDPKDPIYVGSFNVGARTVTDPANYEILKLVGHVKKLFPKGERILIADSYEAVETGTVGVMVPGDAEVITQTYDLLSGVRMVSVGFRAQRFV